MKRPSLAKLQKAVAEFNSRCPVDSWVHYREIMPKGKDPGTDPTAYQVRTKAYVHQGHTAAVFLFRKSGFVDVGHCVPVKWVVEDVSEDPPTRHAGPFDDIEAAQAARDKLESDEANDFRNLHLRSVES